MSQQIADDMKSSSASFRRLKNVSKLVLNEIKLK